MAGTRPRPAHPPVKATLAAIAALAAAVAAAVVLLSRDSAEDLSTRPLGPVPANARYLDPSGSDSGPGSAERPWRTLGRALAAARPGSTVVLRAGTYGAPGDIHVIGRAGEAGAPIVWRADPGGAAPRIVGHVRIVGSHQRFHGLLFDGPTGPAKPPSDDNPDGEQVQIAVGAEGRPVEGVEISGSEIRDSGWHAGIYLEEAHGARLVGNHIHDNGDFGDPSQANQSHGIYWHSGSGLIANNLIEHNVARGIQLYEEPRGVTVVHNTIVRNGRAGIQVGDDAEDNLIANNVVALNGDAGIRAAELSGDGNRAEGNLIWTAGGGPHAEEAAGLALGENIAAPPRFAAGPGYRLGPGSPALGEALSEHAVSHDRDGRERPGEGADLGAYERP
jgi:Right handed beta helix region/Protein of unknown function (DUF1565)